MKDEIIALHKKRILDERPTHHDGGGGGDQQNTDQKPNVVEVDSERVIAVVNKAVSLIMAKLNSLSYFDKAETNKMTTLVQAASNPDNLCCMDPTWHPWL